jgi:hypothetical protein
MSVEVVLDGIALGESVRRHGGRVWLARRDEKGPGQAGSAG